jgi:hypothetical protein
MVESGPSTSEFAKEEQVLSDPEKVLGRIKDLSNEARVRFAHAMAKLAISGTAFAIGSALPDAFVEGAQSDTTETAVLKLVGKAVLFGSGAAMGVLGANDIAESAKTANRANSLEGALTNHLLNKYNTKQ